MKVFLGAILTGGCLWLGCGCGSSVSDSAAGFQDEDPARRIEAIARAGRNRDERTVPFLIDRLTDSQGDVRFFAIIALKKTTGKTMGWNYYDPPPKRTEAVRKWRKWLETRRKDSPRPKANSLARPPGPKTQEAIGK